MRGRSRFRPLISLNKIVDAGLVYVFGAGFSLAAIVSLNPSDLGGTSSFNSAGHWNNSAAPSSGNRYFTIHFLLGSPANPTAYTFAGGSLGADAGGRFLLKGTGGQIMLDKLTININSAVFGVENLTFTKLFDTTYRPTDAFTPNDVVVFHFCQSLAMVAAASVLRFGGVGQ
jgi:hypothetical protein